jgi:hypothetical protein
MQPSANDCRRPLQKFPKQPISRMLKNATEGIDMAMGTDSLGQHARLG